MQKNLEGQLLKYSEDDGSTFFKFPCESHTGIQKTQDLFLPSNSLNEQDSDIAYESSSASQAVKQ